MANYIQKLQEQVERDAKEIAALREGTRHFREYLATNPKFGNRPPVVLSFGGMPLKFSEESDRVDWISISEAIGRLRAIEDVADRVILGNGH